jgi:hypothetical protein
MAAAAVVSQQLNVVGNRRVVSALLTAPADTNTWDTGLVSIDNVQITAASASTVAADSIAVDSISGGVVTFQVAGTARDCYVQAVGI